MKAADGKNLKLPYYIHNYLRLATPTGLFRRRLDKALKSLDSRSDKAYILSRVDYYNKLTEAISLPDSATEIGAMKKKGNIAVYFFDAREFTRWFDPNLKWFYEFGDLTWVPEHPAIIKSRPIAGDNRNSVVLKLEKIRHFTFLDDRIPFRDKTDMSIFRGDINNKPHRYRFMEMYYGSPICDAGVISARTEFPAQWSREKISLYDHLKYKFILAIEGNDVASNLKWIMSSNSLAVMPRPKYETWFMEGTLIPDHHYVEIREDYSDLEEKMSYYIANPDKAEAISRNANEYVKQFWDREREDLISLLVLDKYFRMTGQR